MQCRAWSEGAAPFAKTPRWDRWLWIACCLIGLSRRCTRSHLSWSTCWCVKLRSGLKNLAPIGSRHFSSWPQIAGCCSVIQMVKLLLVLNAMFLLDKIYDISKIKVGSFVLLKPVASIIKITTLYLHHCTDQRRCLWRASKEIYLALYECLNMLL